MLRVIIESDELQTQHSECDRRYRTERSPERSRDCRCEHSRTPSRYGICGSRSGSYFGDMIDSYGVR